MDQATTIPRGPGCVACGDCGCDPETEYGHGQIDACECPGCWDRRRSQLREMDDRIDIAAGKSLVPVLGGALAATPDPGLAPVIGLWVGGACSDCDRPIPDPEDPFETYCADCRLMRRPGGY